MARYAIVTDLNRCVGCLGCTVACKVVNGVPIGNFWNKVLRIGPFANEEGATFPNVYTYFLPVGCQHCADPECVKVCPTEASHVLPDGGRSPCVSEIRLAKPNIRKWPLHTRRFVRPWI